MTENDEGKIALTPWPMILYDCLEEVRDERFESGEEQLPMLGTSNKYKYSQSQALSPLTLIVGTLITPEIPYQNQLRYSPQSRDSRLDISKTPSVRVAFSISAPDSIVA